MELPSDKVQGIDGDLTASIKATDTAGNTTQQPATHTFTLDTDAPDAPASITVGGTFGASGAMTDVSLPESENGSEVYRLDAGGTWVLADKEGPVTNPDPSLDLKLEFDQAVPYGEDLVVKSTDDAGNTTSTLILTEEDGTVNVQASNYDGFNIETIDLTNFDVNMTITEVDLKALSEFSDSLLVRGEGNDTVIATGATSTNEAIKIDDNWYQINTFGDSDVKLMIDFDITNVQT